MAFKSIGALAREVLVKATNMDGDLHFRGAGDTFQSGQVAGSPTTGESGGDEAGGREDTHPAPSPMLSGGASAHASKPGKDRKPRHHATFRSMID